MQARWLAVRAPFCKLRLKSACGCLEAVREQFWLYRAHCDQAKQWARSCQNSGHGALTSHASHGVLLCRCPSLLRSMWRCQLLPTAPAARPALSMQRQLQPRHLPRWPASSKLEMTSGRMSWPFRFVALASAPAVFILIAACALTLAQACSAGQPCLLGELNSYADRFMKPDKCTTRVCSKSGEVQVHSGY